MLHSPGGVFDAHAAAVGGLQTVCAVMDVPDAGLKQASGGGGGWRGGGLGGGVGVETMSQ